MTEKETVSSLPLAIQFVIKGYWPEITGDTKVKYIGRYLPRFELVLYTRIGWAPFMEIETVDMYKTTYPGYAAMGYGKQSDTLVVFKGLSLNIETIE